MGGKRVVCVGELVWDVFGDRRVMGGAPMNAACHLSRLGVPVTAVSRVGEDDLGRESLDVLAGRGLDTAGVQRDPEYPTGRVNVRLGPDNEPSYEIIAPAAWDFIDRDEALALAGGDFVLVFGTLGQRHPCGREAVRALMAVSRLNCYDVNLRPPFTSREVVLESLPAADIVKVNHGELAEIASWCGYRRLEPREAAAALRRRFSIIALVVTQGADGAWVSTAEGVFADPGRTVKVVDTVGAGDAFFAAFLAGRLDGASWPACLGAANDLGAEVAGRAGAM